MITALLCAEKINSRFNEILVFYKYVSSYKQLLAHSMLAAEMTVHSDTYLCAHLFSAEMTVHSEMNCQEQKQNLLTHSSSKLQVEQRKLWMELN